MSDDNVMNDDDLTVGVPLGDDELEEDEEDVVAGGTIGDDDLVSDDAAA